MVLVSLVGWAWRVAVVRRRAVEMAAALDKELEVKKELLDAAVSAGERLADGRPRCKATLACTSAATHFRPKVVRDEGAFDFLRRAVGAPQRLHLAEDIWREPVFCESHVHLARQDYLLKIAEVERARLERVRDEEIDIGHYERVGAAQRIARLVAEHEEKENPNRRRKRDQTTQGVVVPIRASSGGGGT
jgi:hypothetical protein